MLAAVRGTVFSEESISVFHELGRRGVTDLNLPLFKTPVAKNPLELYIGQVGVMKFRAIRSLEPKFDAAPSNHIQFRILPRDRDSMSVREMHTHSVKVSALYELLGSRDVRHNIINNYAPWLSGQKYVWEIRTREHSDSLEVVILLGGRIT